MTTRKTARQKVATTLPDLSSVTLRTWQREALQTYSVLKGLLVIASPGSGKSLVGARVAAMASRPVVALPAAVLPQTEAMYRAYGTQNAVFVSYTKLTRAEYANLLDELKPDVLILDEAHYLKNVRSNSAAKRISRYLVANPAVQVVVLSGSIQSRSVLDWAHLALWALRRRAPVPSGGRDALTMWAERLDQDSAARAAFQAKFLATPGVINESGDSDYHGRVELRVVRREPSHLLNDEWRMPDGWLLGSASEAAGAARNLAWGFYRTRSPRPTPAFLEARRAWAAVVRRVTERGACDTESQVRELRPEEWAAYAAVADVQPSYREEAVWEQPRYVNETLDSLTIRRGTIVWANSVALQERVATVLGCPWHHERGLDAEGVRIDETRAPVVVASMKACHAGFNCQQFNHNIVLEPSADQELTKQLVARTARQGQQAPWVSVDLVVNSYVVENALRQSIVRARVAYEATGKRNPLLQLEGREF